MAAIIEHVQTHPLVKGTVPAPQDGVRSSNIVYVQFKEPVAVDLVRQLEERGVLVTGSFPFSFLSVSFPTSCPQPTQRTRSDS